MTNNRFPIILSLTALLLCLVTNAQDTYWKKESNTSAKIQEILTEFNVAEADLYTLDSGQLQQQLQSISNNQMSTVVYFPNSDGKKIGYKVVEKQLFSTKLAEKFPNIKSYSGYSLDDKNEKIYFSASPKGIQSMTLNPKLKGGVFIQKTQNNLYAVYDRNIVANQKESDFICKTLDTYSKTTNINTQKVGEDKTLRKFRLAVTASGEYTQYHGGTTELALTAINATITRLNAIFETDLAITLELVDNNDLIIFTDPNTDPYDDRSSDFIDTIHTTITDEIGTNNYDVGHLFHLDIANGLAGDIGNVCVEGGKGAGYSSAPTPEGDYFDIEYVAHELGHQFGANHTFSFRTEGTYVQAEPASGSTIMGYAGITEDNDVAMAPDDYFHYYSIAQIQWYIKTHTNCAELIAINNSPPVIESLENYTVPIGTAFNLSAEATDEDGDTLTYCWEQIDDGLVTHDTFGPETRSGANFRSLPPSTNNTRYFPKFNSVLEGNLTQTNPTVNSTWETVSNVGRDLNFAVTVRDNALNGGQVASNFTTITVWENAGPFIITSQNSSESYTAGDVITINWDVAATDVAPINAKTVTILLSVDGGETFPFSLGDSVVNNGRYSTIIPNTSSSEARIMIVANDNVFYAVNATDFTIEPSEIVLSFETLNYEVCQPNEITINFNYETELGFNEVTSFSAVSNPTGLNTSFSSNTANVSGTTITLNIDETQNVDSGIYELTVDATSDTASKQVNLSIKVNNDTPEPIVLTGPIDGIENLTRNTILSWQDNNAYNYFEIDIATDSNFITIVEQATTYENFYNPNYLDYGTEYFWRVKGVNACGESDVSVSYKLTTGALECTSSTAENLPIVISSSGTPTITKIINFTEDFSIADLNIDLGIQHDYFGDLTINLTSPSGTTVTLLDPTCDFYIVANVTFDDQATSYFDCNYTVTGAVKPIEPLSNFNGESVMGDWTLEISDAYNFDGGSLESFSIEACSLDLERPDADNDGVYDDTDDQCLGTTAGATVNEFGCEVFDFTEADFTKTITDITCQTAEDGVVEIVPVIAMDYTVSYEVDSIEITENFTNIISINNLASGSYNMCITGKNESAHYNEYCLLINVAASAEACPRPDADNDGVYDDGDDQCLGTTSGAIVNEYGCEILNFVQSDFEITSQDISCLDATDGVIDISATTSMEYEISYELSGTVITGSFTESFSLETLAPGIYDICISGRNGTISYNEYCSQITILDSTEVCPRPDADNDGVYDDGDDQCLGTTAGALVNEFGCEILNFTESDFTVVKQDTSCIAATDGAIEIGANTYMEYEISYELSGTVITGSFTESFSLETLAPGIYDICISGRNGTISYNEYCSQITILDSTEPCPRPDLDNDGVYDDGDDQCLGTEAGAVVNEYGCEIISFTEEDFTIISTDVSCAIASDGIIEILPTTLMNYNISYVSTTKSGISSFDFDYSLENLDSGDYTICITGTNGFISYKEYCFDVAVNELSGLETSFKTNLTAQQTAVSLSGAYTYFIDLNGTVIETNESEVTLDLINGVNTIEVYTEGVCETTVSKEIFISDKTVLFPNPVVDIVSVFLPTIANDVEVKLFSRNGRLLKNEIISINENQESFSIDLSDFSSGTYFMNILVEGKEYSTHQIIKL